MSNQSVKFVVGQIVFHVANNTRGVVVAIVDYRDHYEYKVCFGHNQGNCDCTQFELADQQLWSSNEPQGLND